MAVSNDLKILNLFKKNGLLSEKEHDRINQIIGQGGVDLASLVREKKIVKEADFLKTRAEVLGVPYIKLSGVKIGKEVLKEIPLEAAKNYKIIAFDKIKNELRVGLVNPHDYRAIEAIDFIAKREGLKAKHYLISEQDFKNIISKYETISGKMEEMIDVAKEKFVEPQGELDVLVGAGGAGKDEMGIIKRAPVSKIVSVIIAHAVEGGASDVHIEPLPNSCRVRYRIDGVLHTTLVLPKYLHTAIISRIKVLSRLKIDETRRPQDGRIRLKVNNREIDFRVSILPLYEEEKAVMRILDIEQGMLTLKDIGFMGGQLRIIEEAIKQPTGMVLVTGPTGSGKSTTIFAMISILNKEGVNIVTLEDPVEYYIEGVGQSQVRPEVGFTFSSGLRAVFRQDPDIIMVGEVRDSETAELAIHAGLTGHLVFSTLHTNDSLGAIPRLIDMKTEPFLIASTLNIVIAQRLVKRICLHCKEEAKLPDDIGKEITGELQAVREEATSLGVKMDKPLKFYRGSGCAYCGGTGYKGRIAIGEVLDITPEMKEIIMGDMSTQSIKEELKNQHFITLRQEGFIKVVLGITTVEEVMRVTRE